MKKITKETLEGLVIAARQGKLGAQNGTGCVYKDGQGRNCAIGFLLRPATIGLIVAEGLNEDTGVSGLLVPKGLIPEVKEDLDAAGITDELASVLQQAHDRASTTEVFDVRLFEEKVRRLMA